VRIIIVANPEAYSQEGNPSALVPDGDGDRLVGARIGRRVAAIGHDQRRQFYLARTQRAFEGILL